MDQNLFKKYTLHIDKQKTSKQELISFIETITGILLEENQVSINGKTVSLTLSSVMRSKLATQKIRDSLKEKGYNLTL